MIKNGAEFLIGPTMAIRQARLNKLGLSALATRERSTGERRRVERNKLFCP